MCDFHSLMNLNLSMKLTGTSSQLVYAQCENKNDIDSSESILKLFNTADGSEEFWAMVRILDGQGPPQDSEKLRICHIQDSAFSYATNAEQLLQIQPMQMLGTALSKKEDRMLEAARLNLKSGNFQKYCDIQMQLGNFEDAMAVAPKVSLRYWQKCLDAQRKNLLQ